jgi:hypothetical protein
MEEFLKRGSQIGGLFESIVTYTKTIKLESEEDQMQRILHYKLVHDILMFIQEYHPGVVSPHFKKSPHF